MTEEKEPASFKYSIWDTRTSHWQPNIKVKSAESVENVTFATTERTETPDETT